MRHQITAITVKKNLDKDWGLLWNTLVVKTLTK